MRNDKIAVIGDKDIVLAFKAIGADVFSVAENENSNEILKKVARNYPIIFITEDIAVNLKETIERYKSKPFPAIIPIPGAKGCTGFGMKGISENVEKAIGTDILHNK